MYSKKVLEHFNNPKNEGRMKDPDGIGQVGNPVCGDVMKVYIKVKENRIADIKFETLGCGAAIATSSMTTELARGKILQEAYEITRKQIAQELDGLPPQKMHCSNLASEALKKAIENYRRKRNNI